MKRLFVLIAFALFLAACSSNTGTTTPVTTTDTTCVKADTTPVVVAVPVVADSTVKK